MMFNRIFTILFLGLLFAGCAQDENGKSVNQAPPVAQKPLPSECAAQAQLNLSWAEDAKAYRYEIHIGLQEGNYYETVTLNGEAKEFTRVLERGLTYYVRLIRNQSEFSGTQLKDISFFIPNCADRASWKSAHPEYEEPIQFNIDWSKLN